MRERERERLALKSDEREGEGEMKGFSEKANALDFSARGKERKEKNQRHIDTQRKLSPLFTHEMKKGKLLSHLWGFLPGGLLSLLVIRNFCQENLCMQKVTGIWASHTHTHSLLSSPERSMHMVSGGI